MNVAYSRRGYFYVNMVKRVICALFLALLFKVHTNTHTYIHTSIVIDVVFSYTFATFGQCTGSSCKNSMDFVFWNFISSITCTMQKWSVFKNFAAAILNHVTTTTVVHKLKIFWAASIMWYKALCFCVSLHWTFTNVHFLLKYVLQMLL